MLGSPSLQLSTDVVEFFCPFSTSEGVQQEASALSSPADCWDLIALTEGDSGCHGCQTTGPAAHQTAGYGVTGDMLNQPLK